MKIKLLVAAIAATACGTNAFAAEIYSGEGSTISLGGYVDVGIGEYDSADEVEVHDVSPRINIAGTQDIGHGFTVDAKGEWALNYLDGGDTSFTTRLGYIGATHEQFGRFVVGTQWSPYYDIAGVADLPIAFANDFLYQDHNNLGTARGEDMVSYRKAIELGDMGSLNLGLAWQGEHTDSANSKLYDARGQIALSMNVYGFNLGYSYNGGDVANVDSHSHVFAFSSGSYGDGLYSAVVYAMNENMNPSSSPLAESDQYEILLAYALGNGWNLSANYEAVVDDKASKTQYSQSALQAEYTFTPKFMGFAGYQFDLGNDISVKEEDKWTIGARYFL
ncbi:membrane protein [Vibrio neptunius]|uniref:porin n=1 Tax=Vibrio neptunius TaxID=170651 RepID=UPI0005FA2AD6|nr:porin [Vibrio neptunius]KJY89934.1 membrane protein [Vibrio neptunius]